MWPYLCMESDRLGMKNRSIKMFMVNFAFEVVSPAGDLKVKVMCATYEVRRELLSRQNLGERVPAFEAKFLLRKMGQFQTNMLTGGQAPPYI